MRCDRFNSRSIYRRAPSRRYNLSTYFHVLQYYFKYKFCFKALDVIRKLKDIMPITRASMLIRIVYSSGDVSAVASEIDKIAAQVVQKSPAISDSRDECFVDVKIDPEYYRRMEDFVKELGI